MKKILSVIALVGLLAFSANAGLQVTPLNGGTNNVAADATNTVALTTVIGVNKSDKLGVLFAFKSNGDGATTNVLLKLDSSIDNSRWQTDVATVMLLGGGPGGSVQTNATITTGGVPFWRVGRVINPNVVATNYITNVIVRFFTKDGI